MPLAARRDEKVELLASVPLFQRCSKRQLQKIATLADGVELPAGKVLAKQGAVGREFFVIVDGAAEVRKNGRRVALLGAGDFFGEIALVTRAPRNATVTLIEPSYVLVMHERSFDSLMGEQPEIQVRVLKALAERLAPSTL